MRNWNPLYLDVRKGILFGFEPTYEELKLESRQGRALIGDGFEPTYEELKQLMVYPADTLTVAFWAYLWGIETPPVCKGQSKAVASFEPTYEELKRFQEKRGKTEAELFWAYLWGIETCTKRGWQREKDVVLSLPMRNWNSNLLRLLCYYLHVLSLPMRNWNYPFSDEMYRMAQSFEPTYEELKQLFPSSSLYLISVLSLPMRNWNFPCFP